MTTQTCISVTTNSINNVPSFIEIKIVEECTKTIDDVSETTAKILWRQACNNAQNAQYLEEKQKGLRIRAVEETIRANIYFHFISADTNTWTCSLWTWNITSVETTRSGYSAVSENFTPFLKSIKILYLIFIFYWTSYVIFFQDFYYKWHIINILLM